MAKQKPVESEDLVEEVTHSESFDMVVEQLVQDTEHVPMASPTTSNTYLSAGLRAFGAHLKGEPEFFSEEYKDLLIGLVDAGIACDFGDGLYGRGHKWHSVYGG